jgi:cellulose synthase/poly-beta-1,6-N-acetylglucosamine synthase-like glycosyltransferase
VTGFLARLVEFWNPVLLWYFALLNLFYGMLFVFAAFEAAKHWGLAERLRSRRFVPDEAFPPVSVLVPAYNEERVIVPTVEALLDLDYPAHEVVVVNDASTDDTLGRLREHFDLYPVPPAFPANLDTPDPRGFYRSRTDPELLVVDVAEDPDAGKAAPLNLALDSSRYPYCVTVDADTVVEPTALRRLARAFFVTDRRVVGSGGSIRVANDVRFEGGEPIRPRLPSRYLAAIQVPEYFRAFLFGRLGWNRLGGNLLISGAFALYEKGPVVEAGGFHTGSITEDLELTVALHRILRERGEPYHLPFVPDPVAWTEVPESLGVLGDQRERWHRGLLSTLFRHGKLFGNPRYGLAGLVAFPYYVLGEMLAPVMELVGWLVVAAGLWLGLLSLEYALLFLGLAYGYQMLLTVASVWMEQLTFRVYPDLRQYLRLLLLSVLEPLGYRQLTTWWRLRAFVSFFRDVGGWGEMVRTGFGDGTETGSGDDGNRR